MTSGAELLERAVHLCRGSVAEALVPYWIGTAPFVAAVVYFCLYITARANVEQMVVPYSLLLTVLWIWMNFWHTVCCDALWRSVSNEGRPEWSWRSIARIAITNAALQGPGIWGLALATCIVLPLPWAYAFLQNCHVYAGRMDLQETVRRASQQAGLWPKQGWQLLCCILLLELVAFLNTMLAIYLGAQFLNTFFGITTSLVQNRTAILGAPFLIGAASLTYFVIDPLWKAAHVLRCFEGESRSTGADLRLLLRRVATIAVLVFATSRVEAQTQAAEKYDRALNEVLQRPEYEWTLQQRLANDQRDSAMQGHVQAFRNWLNKALLWIAERLREFSKEEFRGSTAPPGAGLRWTVIGAVAVCAVAILLLVLRSRRRGTGQVVAVGIPSAQAVDLANESEAPSKLAAEEWLHLADDLLLKGDARLATRAVYLAALVQLDAERLITLGRHKTNLEYQRELSRRARELPAVPPAFRTIVYTFERAWYGGHPVKPELVLDLKACMMELRSRV